MFLRPRLAAASMLILSLGACGGGGGKPDVRSTPPPVPIGPITLPDPMPVPVTKPTGEEYDTPEYRASSAAVAANAIGAWRQGASGKGVTIGFVDTGLAATQPDLAGKVHPSSRDVIGNRPMDDSYGHGTAVAGIAAGARNGSGMQGIAFDASIFMAKADEGCPANCTFPDRAIADGIDAARTAGARVINLSIGGDASGEVLAAARRAIDAGIIIVIGAGNSGSMPTAFARDIAKLAPGQVIIVGGLGVTNADGSINYDVPAIYTTPAGASASSFLTAPGWLNAAPYFKGGLDKLSGTSFAAPVVAGALALLAEAFPMLTPSQLVMLLYKTADDLGASGIDSTFGNGRLNIGKAFQPVGTARLASTMAPVPVTIGALPAAAGDAARRGKLEATILDDFNRPFDINLAASLLQMAEPGPLARRIGSGRQGHHGLSSGSFSIAFTIDEPMTASVPRELRLTGRDEQGSRLLAASAIARLSPTMKLAFAIGATSSTLRSGLAGSKPAGFLLAADTAEQFGFNALEPRSLVLERGIGDWRLSATAEGGSIVSPMTGERDSGYSVLGMAASRSVGPAKIGFSLSRLLERSTVLGGKFDRLLGPSGSESWFADWEFNWSLGRGWTLAGTLRRGWTELASGHFTTSSFSADLSRSSILSPGDTIAVRLAQPLKVEQGSIRAMLPASWDYRTKTHTEALRGLSLAPSGRELMLEAGYQRQMELGSMSFHLYRRTDPGHVEKSSNDLGAALQVNLKL